MSTLAAVSGISIRPWIRDSCWSSFCSLTAPASGSSTGAFGSVRWACAGSATASKVKNSSGASTWRVRARILFMTFTLYASSHVIGRHPAPSAGSVAAPEHPLLVDLGDDIAVAGQQRFGRAHFGAERQLSLREPVGAVLLEFLGAAAYFRPAAARAESTFIHFAARAEVADVRILRRAEWACIETVTTTDAQILRMQHHPFFGGKDAGHRADRGARRVGAMHAGHRDRALPRQTVIKRHHPAPIDAPGHLILVLARGDARVAVDAAVGVAKKLHSRHSFPYPARI